MKAQGTKLAHPQWKMREGFMSRLNKSLITAFMSAAMLLPNMAQAMEIIQFDQMTAQDRQDFLDSLSRDAETVLEQEGRSADAQKVHHLFNGISPGSNLPLGEAELEMNLDNQRVRDAEKHIQNHDAPRIQVESALALTLNAHGTASACCIMQLRPMDLQVC
jgi:hypothetical protein